MIDIVAQRPSRSSPSRRVAELLVADLGGEPSAGRALVPLVYEELKALARRYLAAERRGHSMEPSDLTHEALRRMLGQELSPQGRSHFLALAATAMRRVLVDHARERMAQKRGGGAERVPLSEDCRLQVEDPAQMLALDEALARLAEHDERLARVVELRFLGGLTVEETAASLNVSAERVRVDWRFARAWLNRELLGG
jgi:RNA polymerase sigma factor (TIGR02999 family)